MGSKGLNSGKHFQLGIALSVSISFMSELASAGVLV